MKNTTITIVAQLIERYPQLEKCRKSLLDALAVTTELYQNGGQMLVCGNGGSAADSLHIVGELMKGFVLPRKLTPQQAQVLRDASPDTADYLISNLQRALPAISLVSEIGLTTAYSNDMAADLCFAQQVLGYGRKGDVLFGISTSGNSANVIYAAQVAKANGIKVISLTGDTGGRLAQWSDVLIAVPSSITYQIQEYHLPIYHAYCLAIENEFFGE